MSKVQGYKLTHHGFRRLQVCYLCTQLRPLTSDADLGVGWVHPWVGLGWIGFRFIWTAEMGHYCWTAARKSAIVVLKVTSCCGTDSERPHRCCNLPNKFGSRRIFPILLNAIGREMSPKIASFPGAGPNMPTWSFFKIKGQFAAFCQKLLMTYYFLTYLLFFLV